MTGVQTRGTRALHVVMAKWHAFAGRNTGLPDAIRVRAERLLELDVEPLWARVDRKRRDVVLAAFADFIEARPLSPWLVEDEDYFELTFARFLAGLAERELGVVAALRQGHEHFVQHLARAVTITEQQTLMLDYALALGADSRRLAGDRRAFARWFGADALTDRLNRRVAGQEQLIAYVLARSGRLAARVLARAPADAKLERWHDLAPDALVSQFFEYKGDHRVVLAAFRGLAAALQALPADLQEGAVGAATLQFIYRSALDFDQPVWIQREAIGLVASLSLGSLERTLSRRLGSPLPGDDFFVRAGAVSVWARTIDRHPVLEAFADVILADPSPLVRQRCAQESTRLPRELALRTIGKLVREDPSPPVRIAALMQLEPLARRDRDAFDRVLELLESRLREETHETAYRAALSAVVAVAPLVAEMAERAHWQIALVDALEARHCGDPSLRVRRWSAQARETFLVRTHPDWRALETWLAARLVPGRSGARTRIGALPKGVDETMLGRVSAVLALDDFGLDFERSRTGYRALRGFRFALRAWRVLHELRHPSTDKRQAFRHTVARHYRGTVRAHSPILAEVSQTNVPGEPLVLSSEDGWRPYLPLVDDLISTLDQDWPAEAHSLFTSEGVTRIEAPARFADRLRAWWRLTREFAHFAEMRNWREDDQRHADHYVRSLEALGFRITYRPYADETGQALPADPAVRRFFPALLPLPWLSDLFDAFRRHALSAYENTVGDLAIFVAFVGAYFFGRHLVLAERLRRHRANIPLVVGGWGTRGKSGTERIKAAMFNALGYSVFSKTTGCEAMFVMSRPYRNLRELFLFRPYDKATIWEQANIVRLASRLETDIFLWECMGLTPAYVRVLQQSWMRDDLSTITNAFPDHEDLQGPAGINIPDVMCEFIPTGGRVVTSEEKMLPILRDGARRKDSRLRSTGWLEASLLTDDVLTRFPYEEHPYNIALVLGLADELGIERDFALKEMADRVVLDLGVLKTYPEADVLGRRLTFIMGMSANERYGTINNWTRMGMADHTIGRDPGVWVSTLVNNRADRVPRSRVFAAIMVKDLSVDNHVVIGTNLKGMRGYVEEAWNEWASEVTLWPEGDVPHAIELAVTALRDKAAWSRVPVDAEELAARVKAMLGGAAAVGDADVATALADPSALALLAGTGERVSEVVQFCERFVERHQEFQAFTARLRSLAAVPDADTRAQLDHDFRALLWRWFESRVVYVDDPHTPGDQIVLEIARLTPPGYTNRIMGMQNIKGTGLGFVYAWQAWEQCHRAGRRLASDREETFTAGLNDLVGMPEFGVLSASFLRDVLEKARHHPLAQRESAQAQLAAIERACLVAAEVVSAPVAVRDGSGWLTRFVDWLEKFLDAGDAVRRRRLADAVYRDLVDERISEERAIVEIKRVNARQKGGWLRKQLDL